MARVIVVLVVALLVALAAAAPASAQEWSQWFYHPNSGNYWYCGYWGDQYWCYTELGTWIRAVSPEMMQQVDGWQPVY